MAYIYDDQNIFAKILCGEIPNSTVLETDYTLAFHDINPGAPHHVLVIPKGAYVNHDHFVAEATDAEIIDLFKTIGKVCSMLGVSEADGGDGYRLISNSGKSGVQDVPHLHFHVIGGRHLGPMLTKP
ncbi:MAG: HIT domain-containing protein [Paracoccaceae bacterium]